MAHNRVLHTGAAWVRIAAVPEEVDIALGYSDSLGGLQKRTKVFDVAVDTTIRHQAKEMEPTSMLLGSLERRDDILNVEELLLARQVDADNVLDSPRSSLG